MSISTDCLTGVLLTPSNYTAIAQKAGVISFLVSKIGPESRPIVVEIRLHRLAGATSFSQRASSTAKLAKPIPKLGRTSCHAKRGMGERGFTHRCLVKAAALALSFLTFFFSPGAKLWRWTRGVTDDHADSGRRNFLCLGGSVKMRSASVADARISVSNFGFKFRKVRLTTERE